MLDEILGTYIGYMNNISLYEENGKKIIVVLVSQSGGESVNTATNDSKSEIEEKYSKTIDAISLALLKIHNVVNMDNELRTKDEYINSILVGLTTDFPDLNKSFNDNALEVYKSGKTSIMIVDDDKITCNLISKIFDKKYDIIVANNGQEAIDKLKLSKENSTSISCIFLDLIMPVLDGFSVLDYLNDNPNTLVIVSGGKGANEPITEAQGMKDYLIKKGISEDHIIMEDKSNNTIQNIHNSMELFDYKNSSVGIVSSNFHLYRAVAIAKKQGLQNVSGIKAYSTPYYFPHNALRECFGILKDTIFGNM